MLISCSFYHCTIMCDLLMALEETLSIKEALFKNGNTIIYN